MLRARRALWDLAWSRGLVRETSSNDDVAFSAAARGMVDLCEYRQTATRDRSEQSVQLLAVSGERATVRITSPP